MGWGQVAQRIVIPERLKICAFCVRMSFCAHFCLRRDNYVSDQDTVLEIGCAWGTTSNLLYKRGKYVVAIDKGKSLALAKKEYSHIHFEQLDGFDISAVLRLGIKFNTVYFDISGCRKITMGTSNFGA